MSEDTLKAAYTYNFTQFINWPENKENSPFHFCVLAAKAESKPIFSKLIGRNVGLQRIDVIHFSDEMAVNDLDSCQLVFQPEPGSISFPTLSHGTVFVAFNPPDNDPRVSIALYFNRDGKLRFSVNQNALQQAGVKVSSQLLKLASEVRGKVDHG